jgi:hypothetical protein
MNETSTDIMRFLARRYFNNRCFVTLESYRDKGFVIHHLWYIQNDVKREKYPKGENGRNQYLNDLKPLVERQPYRFILIKNGIHTRLDHYKRGLTRMKRDNFNRLVVAVLLTRKN